MYLSAFPDFFLPTLPFFPFLPPKPTLFSHFSLSPPRNAGYGSQPHRISQQNEPREMTAKDKDQSFGESSESEGTDDAVSNAGNSKIKYTRNLLLGFKMWRKLPTDFDALILRELNGESDGTIEKKNIYGYPSGAWDLSPPGERWNNHLMIMDKENHLPRTCSLEKRNVASQQLPTEDSYGTGVLGRKPLESDLTQLSKSENPYRPPHCYKRLQPSTDISEPGKESLLGSDQRTCADSITGNDNNGYDPPPIGVDYSTKKPLGDCEDSTEGDELFVANETIREIIEEILEDNQLTFDDYWAETLETIHLFQKESCISPTNIRSNSPDSEMEIRFRNLSNSEDEDSLISIHETIAPNKSVPRDNAEAEISLPDEDSLISIHETIAPKKSLPKVNAEAEISLPDEDSLISTYDLITPESLMAKCNTATNMRNKSERPFQFPKSMHPQIFGPEKTSHHNFHPPMLMIPDRGPCYVTSYSVLQQPSILPHLLADASSCHKAERKAHHQFRPLPSQQLQATSTYQGVGSSNAAGVGGLGDKEASTAFSLWHSQF